MTELERFQQQGRAIDGDSLITKHGEETRIVGGNTPERAHQNSGEALPDMPGSRPATYALQRSLDAGAEVEDTGERGYFGRRLQKVTDNRGNVMNDMVATGLADATPDNIGSFWAGARDRVMGLNRRPEWDDLEIRAREERARFVNNRFGEVTDALFAGNGYSARRAKKSDDLSEITGDALARGTDQFQGSLYSFTNVIGETFGSESVAKWGEEGMYRNIMEAAQNPARVQDYEDIDGYRDVGLYVLETVAENSPALAADIAMTVGTGGGAAILAGIGKSTLRRMGLAHGAAKAGELATRAYSKRAAMTGLATSATAQMVGENRMGQYFDGLQDEDGAIGHAWVVGGAQGALEFVGISKIFQNVLRGADPSAAESVLGLAKEAKDVKGLLGALGRGTALGAEAGVTESVTEITQELLGQLGTMNLDPDQTLSFENLDGKALTEAGARGFAFGGSVTTAGATVGGVRGAWRNARQANLERQQAENGGLTSQENTQAEPTGDLDAQVRRRGYTWASPNQSEKSVAQARAAAGEGVQERQSADGSTYLSTDPNDPLLDESNELTGETFAAAKGRTPKEQLDPETLVALQQVDENGNVANEALADANTVEQTTAAMQAEVPDLEVTQTTPEAAVNRRAQLTQELLAEEKVATVPEAQYREPQPQPEPERIASIDDEGYHSASPLSEGELRSIKNVLADWKAGRLDRAELMDTLQRFGIDPHRFTKTKAPVDRNRTMNALRKTLGQNARGRDKVRQQLGIDQKELPSDPWAQAEVLIRQLEQADEYELHEAAEAVGTELRRPQVFREADTFKSKGKVNQPRNLALGRIRSELLKAQRTAEQRAEASGRKGPVVSGRLRHLRELPQFQGTEAEVSPLGLMTAIRGMEDNDVIAVAEALGAKLTDLVQDTEVDDFNMSGLLAELDERQERSRPQPETPEPATLQRDVTPRGQQILEEMDWLFEGDGTPIRPHIVQENLGGAANVEARLYESTERLIADDPELKDALLSAVDQKRANNKNNQNERNDAWIEAWQEVLAGEQMEQTGGPVLDFDAIEGMTDAELNEAIESMQTREEALKAISKNHDAVLHKATVDFSVLQHFADTLAMQGVALDSERLRLNLALFTGIQTESSEVTGWLKEGLDKNPPTTEQVEQARRQADRVAEYVAMQQETVVGTLDEAREQLLVNLKAVVAEGGAFPERALVKQLFTNNLLGPKAITEPDTTQRVEFESATARQGSVEKTDGGGSVDIEDAYGVQTLSPDESSDAIFNAFLFRTASALANYDAPTLQSKRPENWAEIQAAYREVYNEFVADPKKWVRNAHREDSPMRRVVADGLLYNGNTLTERSVAAIGEARKNTMAQGGQNLMLVMQRTLFRTEDGQYAYIPRFIDAVSLSGYGLKTSEDVTLKQVYENFLDNVARMRAGGRTDTIRMPQRDPYLHDKLVIWHDLDGKPITYGEAREAYQQGRAERQKVGDLGVRRDQVRAELEELDYTLAAFFNEAYELFNSTKDNAERERARHMIALEREFFLKPEEREKASLQDEDPILIELEKSIAMGASPLLKRYGKMPVQIAPGVTDTLDQMHHRRLYLLGQMKALNAAIRDGDLGDVSKRDESGDVFGDPIPASERSRFDNEVLTAEEEKNDPHFQAQNKTPDVSIAEELAKSDLDTSFDTRDEYEGVRPFDEPLVSDEDRQVANDAKASHLTPVEVDAEIGLLGRKSPYTRGVQFRKSDEDYFRDLREDKPPKPAPRNIEKKPPFRGIQAAGRAAKRRDFQVLASFTRRMLTVIGRGEGARGIANTPITIVQTGDRKALESIAQKRGQLAPSRSLMELHRQPGYLNLGDTVVISMDSLPPGGNRRQWMLTYAHELGHLLYDQSWHHLDSAAKTDLLRQFRESEGDDVSFAQFKEWFADQMAVALIEDVTEARPGEYTGVTGPLGKVMKLIIKRLKALWQAILNDPLMQRWKPNDSFAGFARKVLRGQVELSHRWDATGDEAMHYTPDKPLARPEGISARIKKLSQSATAFKPSRLIYTTIGRIKGYHPEMAARLFQRAQGERKGNGGYENQRWVLFTRYGAEIKRTFAQIAPEGRKQKAAINQAYRDLRDGKDTKGARLYKGMIDRMMADARKEGWRSDPNPEFFPLVFDHRTVEARKGELLAMARQAMTNVPETELAERVDRILEGYSQEDADELLMAPGRPVGTHKDARELIEKIGADKLAEAGFLMDEGAGIAHHFASGLAKRAAWESTMGGYVDGDRTFSEAFDRMARRGGAPNSSFDPNARYKKYLEDIEEEYGLLAAKDAHELVAGALGLNQLGIDSRVQKSQQWGMGIVNMMILGFSGVASIPEYGVSFARANFGLSDIAASFKSLPEAHRFAHDIGVAMTTGAEQIMRMTNGEAYDAAGINKAQDWFFRLNGQEFVTRSSRVLATAVGMRFVIKAAAEGDYAALAKLGLTPEQVKRWNAGGRPAYVPGMEGKDAELVKAVTAGIAQFVSEASMNPNKFQATKWGNNPYFKMIWHLKQFLFTYGDVLIGGLYRQGREQYKLARDQGYTAGMSAAMTLQSPIGAAAVLIPLTMVSLGLRGLLAGDDRFDEEPEELTFELVRKAGMFAQWDLALGLYQAYKWDAGLLGLTGAVVPAAGVIDQIIHIDANDEFDAAKSADNLKGMVPLAGQWKGTWQWLYE